MKSEKKSLGSVFFVFAGYVLSVTAFVIGGNVGNELSFWNGISALLIGNMVLAAYAGILGYIGYKTQKSSTDMFKPVFGVKGQVVTATVVSLFSLVFVGVYCSLVGSLMASLFHLNSPYIGLLLYLVVITLINMKGFKGMSIISKFAVPAIGLFILYGIIVIAQKIGFSNVTAAVPTDPAPFFTVVSTVAASWMTGATFSSDITRFVKKSGYIWIVTFGSFLCVCLLESVGLICSLGTGESDIVAILGSLNMQAVAFIIYILLTITSGQAVVYIAADALANIAKVIRNKDDGKFGPKAFVIASCVFSGVMGIFMTANGLSGTFLSLLGVIGMAIPPVGGTLTAHFLLVDRDYKNAFKNMPAYRWQAFAAWICGILISNFITFGIRALNGFAAAMLVYFVLCKAFGKKTASSSEALKEAAGQSESALSEIKAGA